MNIPLLIVILYVLLLFGISIYVSYSQKKDSENFLLYQGKNNAFVVAASIAGLAIGTSFIVIGGLLCPKFSSRKAGFWTIMASIVSIVAWNMVPALVPVFKNVGFFMLAVCGAVFILISLVDPEKVKQ